MPNSGAHLYDDDDNDKTFHCLNPFIPISPTTTTTMSQPNPPPLPNLSPPPKAHMLHRDAQIPSPPCSSTAPTLPGTPRSTTPPTTAPPPILVPALAVRRDIRSRMPSPIARFLGHRPHGAKPPFKPLPFPPFSWLRHMPLKYEVWLLSCIGAFVSIALIEAVMASAGGFADTDTVLITASFGASAVLTFATIDSPLAQPLHLVGGQVVCAVVGVCVTRLFHLAPGYTVPLETTHVGDLHQLVWINGALSMALAVVAMQATGTVHPPGGATALIASVQPAVIAMSWRYIYIVLISALLMLGWAMVINVSTTDPICGTR